MKDSAQNARQPFCQATCGDFTFAFFPQISQKAIQNRLFFGTKNDPSNQSALRISYHYFWLLYNPLRAEFWTDQAITFHATCQYFRQVADHPARLSLELLRIMQQLRCAQAHLR
ncbi:MAG: hypothetical protein E7474_08365 [Ruminococcaceae bacterium]|nr:hypothetical protein [Oscillospiraceae bacterium]